ncbi:MAG: hypothetical protein DRR15_19425, partial [Gammaproteobacteria bacterium]
KDDHAGTESIHAFILHNKLNVGKHLRKKGSNRINLQQLIQFDPFSLKRAFAAGCRSHRFCAALVGAASCRDVPG